MILWMSIADIAPRTGAVR